MNTDEARTQRNDNVRFVLRVLLSVIYLAAGVMHVVRAETFVAITPDWVPYPETVILLTGIAEIAGAAMLLFVPGLHRFAGIALAFYAVCVYPANINHAVADIAVGGVTQSWAYHIPRLAFQPVFVWWALYAGGVINWPFRLRHPRQQ